MYKILIVEDDHNLGLMIRDILQFKGYDIILSKKPEVTIDILIDESIDLVLMDKLMSGIDGTDICTQIRKTEGVSNTPILMMSALPDVEEECKAAGATDFIYKPFEIKLLQEKVKNILEISKDIPQS